MDESKSIERVMVTGATGFVGCHVVGELLQHGITPVCLVRSREKLYSQHVGVNPDDIIAVDGSLSSDAALKEAAELSQAAIHLVGIIMERRLSGQTFQSVHVQGTQRVVDAAKQAGIRRFVHMSALGTRERAPSAYHRSKWDAEQIVEASQLDWTTFQPSLIHGPRGEFMRLMKRIMCGIFPPVIPCFGDGKAKVQPVAVEDVARCVVRSLFCEDAIGGTFPMGGPRAYSWAELFQVCRRLIPRAKRRKPVIGLPVGLAKWIARFQAPPLALAEVFMPSLGIFRFDVDQVEMSQEDNTCDESEAEEAFGLTMMDFEERLAEYAAEIA